MSELERIDRTRKPAVIGILVVLIMVATFAVLIKMARESEKNAPSELEGFATLAVIVIDGMLLLAAAGDWEHPDSLSNAGKQVLVLGLIAFGSGLLCLILFGL